MLMRWRAQCRRNEAQNGAAAQVDGGDEEDGTEGEAADEDEEMLPAQR